MRLWRELLSQSRRTVGDARRHSDADRLQARPGTDGGKASLAVDNTLDLRFYVEAADKVWVADITYIRPHKVFAHLAFVLNLFSRRIVGWSMQVQQTTNVALQALLAAVWRRKPKGSGLTCSTMSRRFKAPPASTPGAGGRGRLENSERFKLELTRFCGHP